MVCFPTQVTQILTAVIAEPDRRTVPSYSTGPTTPTVTLTYMYDSLHMSAALDLFEFPLHNVTLQTQPDLVIADLSLGNGPQDTVTGVTGWRQLICIHYSRAFCKQQLTKQVGQKQCPLVQLVVVYDRFYYHIVFSDFNILPMGLCFPLVTVCGVFILCLIRFYIIIFVIKMVPCSLYLLHVTPHIGDALHITVWSLIICTMYRVGG